MKFIIQSEKDLQFLQGKFIVQVNSSEPDRTIMDMDWGFAKEKRIKFVSGMGFIGLYGDRQDYHCGSFEEFQTFFNHYHVDESKLKNSRFHRLLTRKELEYLFNKLAEENY